MGESQSFDSTQCNHTEMQHKTIHCEYHGKKKTQKVTPKLTKMQPQVLIDHVKNYEQEEYVQGVNMSQSNKPKLFFVCFIFNLLER